MKQIQKREIDGTLTDFNQISTQLVKNYSYSENRKETGIFEKYQKALQNIIHQFQVNERRYMGVMNEVFEHLQRRIIPRNNISCYYLNKRHTEEKKRSFPFFTYIIFNVLESIWLNMPIVPQDIAGINDAQFYGIQRICSSQFNILLRGNNEKALLSDLNKCS